MENRNYAPFWSRLLAHNIDLVLFLPVGYGFSAMIPNDVHLYGSLAVVYVIYNMAFEYTAWKGSLGKKLLKIHVAPVQGFRPLWWRPILRNSLKFLSLALLFLGFLMIRFNMKRQGLHDWLSGSVVISG